MPSYIKTYIARLLGEGCLNSGPNAGYAIPEFKTGGAVGRIWIDRDTLNCGHRERGYTIVEVLIVVAVALIMVAGATPMILSSIQNSQVGASLQIVTLQTRLARQLAMSNRRDYRVDYSNYALSRARVSIVLLGSPETIVSQTDLIGGMTFGKVGDPPAPDSDYSTILSQVFLNPDGTVTNAANNAGGFSNGTVYLSKAGDSSTNRAISIMGATGRIKGYQYNQSSGIWMSGL